MRILITAGPTREYLDDVRYLSNASSGRMGYAIAEAVLAAGHQAVLVSGPVMLTPPHGSEVHPVETTAELHDVCNRLFQDCDGAIATAAVCDYRPRARFPGKLAKTGVSLELELVETADVLADLGLQKGHRWLVGFALESDEFAHVNALRKLKHKNCDAIVLSRVHPIFRCVFSTRREFECYGYAVRGLSVLTSPSNRTIFRCQTACRSTRA